MKQLAVLLALSLTLGCASSKATANLPEPELTIQQISTVASAARHVEGGIPVKYRVRVANKAGEPITLRRISLISVGEGAYKISASNPFNTVVQPDRYEVVEFWAPANIDDPTILGANGPVTLRVTAFYDSPVGQFQQVVVQQVHEDLGDTNVPQ